MSAAEQVAEHLRAEALRGGLGAELPGIHQLAAELAVNHKTVAAAVRQLENERLLLPQGTGRPRRIVCSESHRPQGLRLGILTCEATDRGISFMVELRHVLEEAGHSVFFAPRYLFDPGMDVERVAQMVRQHPADAWLVVAGSRELLEWFSGCGIPVMAIFGRRRGTPIASVGPDKVAAMAAATRELIRLGHRRIVLLTRRMRRIPEPGAVEQTFLNELTFYGIATNSYHLPDWGERVEEFHAHLGKLFHITAPTALILDEVPFFMAAQQFLAEQGIRVPGEVSLLCTDASPDFHWCRPTVAHIRWDSRPLVRRVLQWAGNVAHGRKDLRQMFTKAEFVNGGTIGRVE